MYNYCIHEKLLLINTCLTHDNKGQIHLLSPDKIIRSEIIGVLKV